MPRSAASSCSCETQAEPWPSTRRPHASTRDERSPMTASSPPRRSPSRTGAIRPTPRIGGSAARCARWSSARACAAPTSTACRCRASPSAPTPRSASPSISGFSPRWLDHVPLGGASGVVALRRAARAVQCGDAEFVVCVAGDTNQVDSFRRMLSTFSRFAQDAVYPYGSGGPNASFALITSNYMKQLRRHARGFRQDLRRPARQRAVLPARADEEAADARRVHVGAADLRSDPSVRLRDALRRRRGLPGLPRGRGERSLGLPASACSPPSSGTTPSPTIRSSIAAAGRWMSTSSRPWPGVTPDDVDFVADLRRLSGDLHDADRGPGLLRQGRGAGLRPLAHASPPTAASRTTPRAASSRSARPARPAASSAWSRRCASSPAARWAPRCPMPRSAWSPASA